jgi:WD40 repeat protein
MTPPSPIRDWHQCDKPTSIVPSGAVFSPSFRGLHRPRIPAKSHKERATLKGHRLFVRSVAFHPNGRTLASGCSDGLAILWDVLTGKQLATLEEHEGPVNSVVFSPDGSILASGGSDSTIKLWDASTFKVLVTIRGHSESVMSIAFSPDGKLLASGSYDCTVKLWAVGALLKGPPSEAGGTSNEEASRLNRGGG